MFLKLTQNYSFKSKGSQRGSGALRGVPRCFHGYNKNICRQLI